jgi:hypothetical protein
MKVTPKILEPQHHHRNIEITGKFEPRLTWVDFHEYGIYVTTDLTVLYKGWSGN